ncbi:MAG: oligosaccharide flippase family protein [Methylococcaceae bacterium]|jgi:O-antigen/teichoic acid export membrane protein
MGALKKLASQTAVYGLSSIVGRSLNYLLVPLYTYYFSAAEYGVVSEFYAYAGFFSVLLVLGFETGYFRFRDKDPLIPVDVAYSTALIFIVLVNLSFLMLIIGFNPALASAINYAAHPEYVLWFATIIVLDAVACIPFARLRAQNKAISFATIKLFEIFIAILFSLFFIVYCPKAVGDDPKHWVTCLYNPNIGVGYIFIANLLASISKFVLLLPQLKGVLWGFNKALFMRMLRYSLPMVVIGFAGIINEMLDRVLLKYLLPYDDHTNLAQLGIYSACYKLSILMSLFIQAFRYAAEPFFFAHAGNNGSRQVYADVLRFFVIFGVFIFLLVTLFIDFFQYFIGAEFRAGLDVVPILLMANLCLGIYINLSVWYKLTDHTSVGALVAFLGAGLTIALNVWWIPQLGYMGSAWATLACYAMMALLSYALGRHYFPVNYDIKRLLCYIGLGLALFQSDHYLIKVLEWPPVQLASVLLTVYLLAVLLFERRFVLLKTT